jgi:hypothetical protein
MSVSATKPLKARLKKGDTSITAEIFIGIGNKPYLRGSGAGLSWEQGSLMEFVEIGVWRWVAPEDFEEAIEVQVYRNDADQDLMGTYAVEPGAKLVMSPKFD